MLLYCIGSGGKTLNEKWRRKISDYIWLEDRLQPLTCVLGIVTAWTGKKIARTEFVLEKRCCMPSTPWSIFDIHEDNALVVDTIAKLMDQSWLTLNHAQQLEICWHMRTHKKHVSRSNVEPCHGSPKHRGFALVSVATLSNLISLTKRRDAICVPVLKWRFSTLLLQLKFTHHLYRMTTPPDQRTPPRERRTLWRVPPTRRRLIAEKRSDASMTSSSGRPWDPAVLSTKPRLAISKFPVCECGKAKRDIYALCHSSIWSFISALFSNKSSTS